MSVKSTVINILPDATLFSSIVFAYFLDRHLPIIEYIPHPINLIGWPVAVIGAMYALHIISIIRLNATTSNVTDIPPALITKGLYRVSRNPFYLSYVAITIGVACILGSIGALSAPLICIAVLQCIVIPVEEKRLQAAWGKEYVHYKQLVRRWI